MRGDRLGRIGRLSVTNHTSMSRSSHVANKGRGRLPDPPPVHLDRLRRALSLGLRPSIGGRRKIWCNTDAQVQGQAARAILAVLNAYKSNLHSIHKQLLEDTLFALEGLLMAEMEQVYIAAAEAALVLVKAHGNLVMEFGFHQLAIPLVHLLQCSKSSTVALCASALQNIIVISKPRFGLHEDELWKVLKDADVLITLVRKIQLHNKFDGEGISQYVSIADLFSTILQHWPSSRFCVGENICFRRSLLLHCSNASEAVSCAALRVCAALALCGGVALLQIRDNEATCCCLVDNTNASKTCSVRIEAFRFLSSLSESPTLSTTVSLLHLKAICRNTVDAIAEGFRALKKKFPEDVKTLTLEASQAACKLLRLPGKHHLSFWRAGCGGVICRLLVQLYGPKMPDPVATDAYLESNHKPTICTRIIGPILWNILGWLAAHALSVEEETSIQLKQQELALSETARLACGVLLKAVDRRGCRAESDQFAVVAPTDLEKISICKAVLLLLSSPSHLLASSTKHCLEQVLEKNGYDWVPGFVRKLSVTFNSTASSDDIFSLTGLLALCSLSNSVQCQHRLVEEGVLEALTKSIRGHSLTIPATQRTSATHFSCAHDVPTCCWDHDNLWEGQNPILFFSLWAFARLACGSSTAKSVKVALMKRLSENVDWSMMPDDEVESHLLLLVSSTGAAAGLRWWASCCLACCGAYGFPSQIRQLSKLFNDANSADLKLLFADGSHVYAHKVILATRCPELLPPSSNKRALMPKEHSLPSADGFENTMCQLELRLSACIHREPMQAVLEFLYKGFVLIEEQLVSEVKLLAKRCHLEALSRLLQGKIPLWGSVPAPCDFIPALGSIGCSFSDISLEDGDAVQSGCVATVGDVSHLHAHRAILSSQCSYFQGLFRSGMQESVSKSIRLPLTVDSVKTLLYYLYSMNLPQFRPPESGCMWSFTDRSKQLECLKSYVKLAQLAEQWLLEDLKEQCLGATVRLLVNTKHLGPEIMAFSADCEQWTFVKVAAECISSDYPKLRDSGGLDALEDNLVDAIRAAYVSTSMNFSG